MSETKIILRALRELMALAEEREVRVDELERENAALQAQATEPPDMDDILGDCKIAVRAPKRGPIVAMFCQAAEAHSWAKPQFKEYEVVDL